MRDEFTPNVGPRIRAIRERRGFSLRDLAERCNLSVNAISLIERGENSPTVSSLHTLATGLSVKITDFFEEPSEYAVVFVGKNQRITAQGNELLMESLGTGLRNQQLEPFMVTMEPSIASSNELIVHPGQEFVHCLVGEIQYQIGGQLYSLKSGDSLLFDATQPHCFKNVSEVIAQVLLVFQAVEGGYLARQRHLET